LFDGLSQDVRYYYESTTPSAPGFPDKSQFIPLKNKINGGFKNGTYWFLIEQGNEKRVLELSNTHLWDVSLYDAGSVEYPASENTLFKTFELNPRVNYLLRVITHKEAHIPLNIYPLKKFQHSEKKRLFFLGIYYGFALIILIINIYYFSFFKEKSFLFYALFLFATSLLLFHRDGLINFFTDSQRINFVIEPFIHILVPISGIIFASNYLELSENWSNYKFYVWPLAIGTVIFMTAYLFFESFFFFIVADVCAILTLLILWLSGLYLAFKNTFSLFFTLAYSIILVLAFDFFISPLFGWPNIGITTDYLKIGGYIEMLFLNFAVVYRMQLVHKQNEFIEAELYSYTQKMNALGCELQQMKGGKANTLNTENLSAREVEILQKIALGKLNKQIADELYISINTVKFHTKNLYAKLNVKGKNELIVHKTQHLNN
jgi:DNA-binding CsgD family transcriptional regulator